MTTMTITGRYFVPVQKIQKSFLLGDSAPVQKPNILSIIIYVTSGQTGVDGMVYKVSEQEVKRDQVSFHTCMEVHGPRR